MRVFRSMRAKAACCALGSLLVFSLQSCSTDSPRSSASGGASDGGDSSRGGAASLGGAGAQGGTPSSGGTTTGGRGSGGEEMAGRGGVSNGGSAGSAAGSGASNEAGATGEGGDGAAGRDGGAGADAGGVGTEIGGAGGADGGGSGGTVSGGVAGSESGGTSGSGGTAGTPSGGTQSTHWVGTWANGPQLTEPSNLPPSPGLAGNTLRQIAHVSIGGQRLRAKFSNAYGSSAVELNSVHVAISQGGSTIVASSDKALTFNGSSSIAIGAGGTAISDPFDFALDPVSDLAVTIQFGAVSSAVTGHPGSRATSYLQEGNAVTAASMPAAATTEHWYILTGIDVLADSESAAIVVLGDSLSDGRGSTTNGNNRWPDDLARRLLANAATSKVAVLNLGIGGNAVLSGGLGPPAVQRFDADVLGQSGARWLVVLEGVNDIGGSTSASVADGLIAAYQQFVDRAHTAGLVAYGVPILPFGGSSYASAAHESARQAVNTWIRASNHFDAVIDLDGVVRDSADLTKLQSIYDSGDHLHLNVAGYQRMADSVDLGLFSP